MGVEQYAQWLSQNAETEPKHHVAPLGALHVRASDPNQRDLEKRKIQSISACAYCKDKTIIMIVWGGGGEGKETCMIK